VWKLAQSIEYRADIMNLSYKIHSIGGVVSAPGAEAGHWHVDNETPFESGMPDELKIGHEIPSCDNYSLSLRKHTHKIFFEFLGAVLLKFEFCQVCHHPHVSFSGH
jgi:hypothetical protein